jgi:hypothetical protein
MVMLLGLCLACISTSSSSVGVSLQEGLERAVHEAQSLGYNPCAMKQEYDSANTAWEEFVASQGREYPSTPLRERLDEARYWAIYFGPSVEGHMGGDLWVFISRANGECLGVIRGK